jgi:hypothetical protein
MIGGILWIIGGSVIFVGAIRGKLHHARPGGYHGDRITKRWEKLLGAGIGAAFVVIGIIFVLSSR